MIASGGSPVKGQALMNAERFFDAQVIDDDILVIVLRGSLDVSTNEEFDREIKKHLAEGHKKIVIDCRYLGFISSLGIGSLVALQTRLRRQGGVVKLAAVQGLAAKTMRLVSLDKLLDFYGDLEFARQSFDE